MSPYSAPMLTLLRSVKRSIQAIGTKERNTFCCYHLNAAANCANKDLTVQKSSDDFLESIKSATSSSKLLDALTRTNKSFNSQQIMVPFKTLFTLQKVKESRLPTSEILQHSEFKKLCKSLQSTTRFLDVNDIIDALKILLYFGVTSEINLNNALLNQLRKRINELQLGHIVFIYFLLQKLEKTPLVEALQIALPTIFELQIKQQLDHENVGQLTELLQFVSNNIVSQQCIMNIVSALTLHGTNIKLGYVKSIIRSLCALRDFKSAYEKLLFNCFIVLNKNFHNLNFDDIDQLLRVTIERYHLKNGEIFYNEEFCNKCALFAVEMNIGIQKTGFILKKFNKLHFANMVLLDHIAENIIQNPNEFIEIGTGIYLSLVSSLSTANYLPKNWDRLKSILMSHPVLQYDKNNLPWMKLCAELMSLGCYDENVLNRIFSDDFLDKHLSRQYNILDYVQMLAVYQSVVLLVKNYGGNLPAGYHLEKAMEINRNYDVFPLKSSVENILGGEKFVCTKVTTKYGHLIDHVIIFDENCQPLAINENEKSETDQLIFLEDLPLDKKVITVHGLRKSCYVLNYPRVRGTFDLKLKTIEALGVSVIAVNVNKWTTMPDKERIPFLEREINLILKKLQTEIESQ